MRLNQEGNHYNTEDKNKFMMVPIKEETASMNEVSNHSHTKNKIVFKTSELKINPLNILCMNIPAYMGGVTDMWNHSKQEAPYRDVNNPTKMKSYTLEQNIDDGILEFLSFSGKISFGMLERICRGWGKRMCQGKPLNIFGTMLKLIRQWPILDHIQRIFQRQKKTSICLLPSRWRIHETY